MDKTLANFKHLNALKGMYFFNRDTMKFWNSKIHGGLIKGKYFITSEDNYNRTSRLFTVRVCNWETGTVKTLGDFQEFKTKEKALDAINKETKEAL